MKTYVPQTISDTAHQVIPCTSYQPVTQAQSIEHNNTEKMHADEKPLEENLTYMYVNLVEHKHNMQTIEDKRNMLKGLILL